MLPLTTPCRSSKPVKTEQGQELIHHSYTIYTPKILTFSYHPTSSRKSSQLDITNKSTQIHPSTKSGVKLKPMKINLLAKQKYQKNNRTIQSQHLKPIKISLLSSRKSYRHPDKFDRVLESRISAASQPVKMVELPNHITVSNFIESISCDIFSQCNDLSQVDQGQRKPVANAANGSNVQIKQLKGYQDVALNKRKKQKVQIIRKEPLEYSDAKFKRKNIFQISQQLNNTIDLSFRNSQRSRSKKSIFKPRDRSSGGQNRDASLVKRKSIFKQTGQSSPCFAVKCVVQTLEQSDIPNNILESWEKFQQSSELWSEHSFSGTLGVVKEAGLQQSQASAMR